MKRESILIWTGLGVLVLLLAGFLYGAYQNMFTPSFVTASATAILVLVTAGYAVLTFRLVRETRQARKQEVIPAFKLDLQPWAIGKIGVVLENIGNGPAQNIEATLSIPPADEETEIEYPNVAPGSQVPIPEPFDEVNISPDNLEEYEHLKVEGTCEDLFGNEYPIYDTYDLSLFEEVSTAESLMNRDKETKALRNLEKEIRDTNRELKDISRELSSVESAMSSLGRRLR